MRRQGLLAGVVAMIMLAGCGSDGPKAGVAGSGATTPTLVTGGVQPVDNPLTGSAQNPSDPGRTPSVLVGGAADPVSGLAGGEGVTPTPSPGITALQILGIPVNALPPEVVAALVPPTGTGGGTNSPGGGTNTGGGTTGGGTTGGGTTGGGTTGGGTTGGGTTGGGTTGGGTTGGGTTGGGTTGGGTTGGGTTGGGTTGGGTTGGGTTGGGTTGGSGTTLPIPTSTAFCPPARDLSAALDAVGAAESPGALESAVGWARSSFRTAQATAPAALRGDVDTLARAFGQLFDAMEQVGYHREQLKLSAFSALASDDARAAKDRFNQYMADVC